ncbi:hypothetical protein F4774DRAFT_205282 [Daldinia eschscholtzii]|nr:hypothetical protein F4774DRAFT_205282 [Daldinia eschscholtzii]
MIMRSDRSLRFCSVILVLPAITRRFVFGNATFYATNGTFVTLVLRHITWGPRPKAPRGGDHHHHHPPTLTPTSPNPHHHRSCFDLQPGISPRFAEWHDQTYPRFGSDFIIFGLATLLATCHGFAKPSKILPLCISYISRSLGTCALHTPPP